MKDHPNEYWFTLYAKQNNHFLFSTLQHKHNTEAFLVYLLEQIKYHLPCPSSCEKQ